VAAMLVTLVGLFANGSALENPGLRTAVKASTLQRPCEQWRVDPALTLEF
jgi:hypothetical protein